MMSERDPTMTDDAGEVPVDRALAPVQLAFEEAVVVARDPAGPATEAIAALRSHLEARHTRQGRRGLVVCSTTEQTRAGELAANLALSFAQAGVRTLIVDADLSAPSLDRLMIPSVVVPTLRDLLDDPQRAVGSAIVQGGGTNLSLLYAGPAVEDAQRLVAGPRFAQIMETCLRDFDLTIVTTPASNTSSAARRIASVVHYALIVVRKDKSYVADVDALIDELTVDGSTVVGTVFNAD